MASFLKNVVKHGSIVLARNQNQSVKADSQQKKKL